VFLVFNFPHRFIFQGVGEFELTNEKKREKERKKEIRKSNNKNKTRRRQKE